jgi:hypothetical protein
MPKTPTVDLEQPKVENNITSPEDSKTIAYVIGRFKEMQIARNVEDKNWTLYQKQMEALYMPYPD